MSGKVFFTSLFISLLTTLSAGSATELKGSITGTVIDATDPTPVAYATI